MALKTQKLQLFPIPLHVTTPCPPSPNHLTPCLGRRRHPASVPSTVCRRLSLAVVSSVFPTNLFWCSSGFKKYGFVPYFNILPGTEWSALMLTYGSPVAVIGMALKHAELKPIPCVTYVDAKRLREKCATDVLKQVKSVVTGYRYEDEQRLDEALKWIFQYDQLMEY